MFWRRLKQGLNDWLNSSVRERQRILWLLPLLAGICLLFAWQGKPRFERSFTLYSDAVATQTETARTAGRKSASKPSSGSGSVSGRISSKPTTASPNTRAGEAEKPAPFFFDPNTIDREGLVRLGFSQKQAQVILNYREAGAVFRKPEDFARCYTVSDEKYAELAPYIRIGESSRTKPAEPAALGRQNKPESPALPGNTDRPDTVSARKSHPHASPTELNTADSAALVALRGIGPLSAGRILRYRQRLGGFARAEQLREVQGILEENYQLILQQIFVDSSKIQKIDINFATPERMAGHPYLPPRTLDKILKNRQLKGGWSSTRELIEEHILSGEQAERLAPYLCFGAR